MNLLTLPLFLHDADRGLDCFGTCVLAKLDNRYFAFTAAHVIHTAGHGILLAPTEAKGGTLRQLPPLSAHLRRTKGNSDLDVAVLPLDRDNLGPFQHHAFLTDAEVDHVNRPDDESTRSSYLVLGYPASRSQARIDHAARRIHQQSFHCTANPVGAEEYDQEGFAQLDHLLLDFDHDNIVANAERTVPPRLQGVSGGGMFHLERQSMQGPLVAIATDHRRNSRLIAGTRIKHFIAIALEC